MKVQGLEEPEFDWNVFFRITFRRPEKGDEVHGGAVDELVKGEKVTKSLTKGASQNKCAKFMTTDR